MTARISETLRSPISEGSGRGLIANTRYVTAGNDLMGDD